MKLSGLLLLAVLPACAHVHIVCPVGTVGVTMSGNNVGTGLIATATSALGAAKLLGRTNDATASGPTIDPNLTTIDYSTIPMFGPEGEMCVQPTSAKPVDVNVVSTVKPPQ